MRIRGKQIAFLCPIVVLAVLLAIFLSMWISTAQVMRDVKDVIYGRVDHEQIAGTKLEHFDFTDGYPDAKVSLSMGRIFVLCGTQHGCMWVRYSYDVRSKSGDPGPAGSGIISHWEIEKINGKWEITDVSEHP